MSRSRSYSHFSDTNSDSVPSNDENEQPDPSFPHRPSPARRSHQSRVNSFESLPATRLSHGSGLSLSSLSSSSSFNALLGFTFGSKRMKKKRAWYQGRLTIGLVLVAIAFVFMNWWMLSRIQNSGQGRGIKFRFLKANSSTLSIREELIKLGKGKKPQKTIYARLLAKAAHALAEGQNKPEPKDLWAEPYFVASTWKPCSEQRDWRPSEGKNGYIMVTANGGINQQRVAVCNAVAVARLLDAALVLPKFLYSSVWKDMSQFGDIYQDEYFINYLKPDISVVRELPHDLQSLDLEAVGSLVTDVDIVKEAKPSFYTRNILPILHQNRVVHFVGFGNRLASDPLPFQLQM